MAKDWLRKMGTTEVFVWTPVLSERADMQAISEKEALALIEANALRKPSAEKPAEKPVVVKEEPKPGAGPDVHKMGMEELLALAAKLKIIVKDKTPLPAIRAKILSVMEAYAETTGAKAPAPTGDQPADGKPESAGGTDASTDGGTNH